MTKLIAIDDHGNKFEFESDRWRWERHDLIIDHPERKDAAGRPVCIGTVVGCTGFSVEYDK